MPARPQLVPRLFDPKRPPERKYFTRVPDDALEDPRLTRSDLAVLTQLIKGHWRDDKPHTITQTELARRCRMTVRRVRPHLNKLELCEYITRLRIPGQHTQVMLTYQLRPILELAPDEHAAPVTRGTRDSAGVGRFCPTPRTKTSDPPGPKRPTPRTKTSDPSPPRKGGEKEKRGESELPPLESCVPQVWDSRQQEVIDLATQRWGACNGDSVVGDLLRLYPAELVMEAIDRHWAKVGPGLRPAYLIATCRGMFDDGWKPESENRQPVTAPSGNGALPKSYGIIPGP
jgi:hypothetical protein